jgi:hypothetical protein
MTQCWCVNFDHERCLKHGIKRNLWMMQYQYEDDFGNVFQGDRKPSTTANWRRLTQIRAGDRFVAYLPKNRSHTGNAFFAVGRVCTPRKPAKSDAHVFTVAEYVRNRRSHEFKSGVVHYTDAPVFYEDFDDRWRSDDPLMRYAQRIDVEQWLHFDANGIPWLPGLDIPPYEIQRAFFRIDKKAFDKITKQLVASSNGSQRPRKRRGSSAEIVDDAAVEALEMSHARSHGFMLDSKLRAALEQHSMDAAKCHFRSLGYAVEDCSKNHPYDLRCVREKETRYVEVKGTQTDGQEIILTCGEVEFARKNAANMVLFILHSIAVSKDRKLSKGEAKILQPWTVEQATLNPLSYNCILSNG